MTNYGLMNSSRQQVIAGLGGFNYTDVVSVDPFDAFQLPSNAGIVHIHFSVDEVFDTGTQISLYHNGDELLANQNLTAKDVIDIGPTGQVYPHITTVKFQLNQLSTKGSARFLVEYVVIGRTQFTED